MAKPELSVQKVAMWQDYIGKELVKHAAGGTSMSAADQDSEVLDAEDIPIKG